MRILITGGAGFIGRSLCARLLKYGNEIICVDNFSTSSRADLNELMDHRTFEVIRHDITFPLSLEADAIYNLACPASPKHYQRDPIQTMKTNMLGAINMLDLAKRLRVPILQASTSEVYGDPDTETQDETYWGNVNPIGLRACYDEGKRAAEALFFDYHRQYDVQIRVARIFNTYGPGMRHDDGRVISTFAYQAKKGLPLTIYGDGSQTRSFCYIDDMVNGLIRLMESDCMGPVNLGNPEEVTISALADTILEMSGSTSGVEFKPLPKDDPKQRCPDISLARACLNWCPTVDLKTGLRSLL